MSEVNNGWPRVPLREVTERVPSIDPHRNPEKEFEYVDISAVDNERNTIGETKRFLGRDAPSRARRPVRPNDVLFSNVRTYLRNIAIVPADSKATVCSTGFTVLRPKKELDPRYLFRYVLTPDFIDRVTPTQTGTHYPATSDRAVLDEWIPLPPIEEQRRIVAKLEALLARVNAARERLDKIPTLLKRFRQAVLTAACTGQLTADWRRENPNIEPAVGAIERLKCTRPAANVRRGVPDNVPQTYFGDQWEVPATWASYSAAALLRSGAFIDLKDGNHGVNHPKVSEFTANGLPFITAAQVNNFRIDYDGAYKISGKPLAKIRIGLAKKNDVIYTHKGSVGRVAIADRDCVLTPQTTYYRVSHEVFVSEFLMFYLASTLFSDQANAVKEQTTRDFVPISEQYRLFHRIPPLLEQREIVRRAQSLLALEEHLEARYLTAEGQVEKLAQSISSNAFSGDLVLTEPDLPAR